MDALILNAISYDNITEVEMALCVVESACACEIIRRRVLPVSTATVSRGIRDKTCLGRAC